MQTSKTKQPTAPSGGLRDPFNLDDADAYANWRAHKLHHYPQGVDELLVPIKDARALLADELSAILQRCRKTNMAVYQLQQGDVLDKEGLRALGGQLGLQHLDDNLCADEDAISSLQVSPHGQRKTYIPYSNRPISWHTDGYYNGAEQNVRAMVLHCARTAAEGGENTVLDHEIAYIHLRDINPDYISALMQADAMTIPANDEGGVEIRGAQTGPVFSVDPLTGNLHMRYTARTRSIEWKDDPLTREAVDVLQTYLDDSASPYFFQHRLASGQGLICNNVLHKRSAFTDDAESGQTRLLYRARYYDRIRDTDLVDCFPQSQEF